MNPNDFDDDGNNIVPCPICMDTYCPSKEGGKCPDEDEFVRLLQHSDVKMKMVLAGNREQFERYLAENGLTDSEARYVYAPVCVRGYGHDYEIVEYGTYYEHPHYYSLKEFLVRNLKK